MQYNDNTRLLMRLKHLIGDQHSNIHPIQSFQCIALSGS